MHFICGDIGFSGLLLLLLSLLVPFFFVSFSIRRRWRIATARKAEIRRLVFLASQEAARAEIEASVYYGSAPVVQQLCAVCYCPTTTRCSSCKAVRYCSGKCQIIHWRQGHKEECHPPATSDQFSGKASDSCLKSTEQAERYDFRGNSLEIDDDWHANPTKRFPEIPASSTFCCSSEDLGRKDGAEAKPPASMQESIFSSDNASSVTEFSTSIIHPDPLVSVSVTEISGSSTPSKLNRLSDDVPDDTLNMSADASVIRLRKSTPPDFSCFTHPVNSIPFSSRLKKRTPSKSNAEVDCGSSDSSCLSFQSSHEHAISEPSRIPSESVDATLISTVYQEAGHDGDAIRSDFQFSFNLSNRNVSSACSQNSSLNNCISDYAHRLISKKTPSLGTSPSKILATTDMTTPDSPPLLSCERSSTVVTDRSNEQLPKSRRALSISPSDDCSRGQAIPRISSSKVDNIQTMRIGLPETASSVLNGAHGLKTSMRKVVQQLRSSKFSKHRPLGYGHDIFGKYNYKMLFPYDQFVKLYNWDKVELQPCGLTNCGNSCYANAVLQSLAFTQPLTAYLLQGLHTKACPKKEWCFTCELESLVLTVKKGRSPISPIGILSQIKSIGSHLGPGREEDAHEFIRYAIDAMQSVCLKEAGLNVDPMTEETTLIQLIFGGYLRSKIKCMKCHGKSERHERMMDLTVEIHGDIGTLEEALARFTATEILDGDNKYQCCRCKSYEKAKKKLTVLEAPNILTIALKRFQSGKFGKLNKSVRFPEILNLAPYMSSSHDKSPVYSLYAVVVHLDVMNAAFSGHYVCYVKNIQGKWFKIDDSMVKPVKLDRVLSKKAYMLLYARCSPCAPSLVRNIMAYDYAKTRSNRCTESIPFRHYKDNIINERLSSSRSYAKPPVAPQWSEDSPNRMGPDGHANFETFGLFNQRILGRHGIPNADASSDSSSLFSCSDEASCSTESTRYSTSTDEYSEYIFGDSSRFSWNSPPRRWEDCDVWSSPSTFSVCSASPDGVLNDKGKYYDMDLEEASRGWSVQNKREEVFMGKESSPLYSDTAKQYRKLKSHTSSNEIDWELFGWFGSCDVRWENG